MPPEIKPGSPSDWLRHAKSDLALAKINAPADVLPDELCFHAQQAAEKAIKAILVQHHIPIIKTHNIGVLIELLPDTVPFPEKLLGASVLTDYAVSGRYPGDVEPVSSDEYKDAIKLAGSVVSWAESIVNG